MPKMTNRWRKAANIMAVLGFVAWAAYGNIVAAALNAAI